MTISLKNQTGSLLRVGPLPTTDARYHVPTRRTVDDAAELREAVDAALADIDSSVMGLLDPPDLASIKAILGKYGSGAAPVSPSGTARGADSAQDAQASKQRKLRAQYLEQTGHNAAVGKQLRDFWDKAERDYRDSIPR